MRLASVLSLPRISPVLALGACGLCALLSEIHAADVPADAGAETTTDEPLLAWRTYLVLQKTCSECHGGHLAKPKGKLGYILDLPRLIEEAYVVPGSPEKSDLFTSLVSDDPDVRMPPEDGDGPRPTPEEIETVRDWIAAGAKWQPPTPEAVAGPDQTKAAGMKADPSWTRILGRMHPLVVHFPIALLLCAAAGEVCFLLRPSLAWIPGMVRGCLMIGALAAVASAASGWLHAREEDFGATAETHRWLGMSAAALAVAAFLIHQRFARAGRGRLPVLCALLATAALVALAGHTGGLLTWGDSFFLGR